MNGIQKAKNEIEKYKLEADQAEREGNYGKVAEIRYGRIKEAENQYRCFKGTTASRHRETNRWFMKKLALKRLQKWFRAGQESLSQGCCKAKEKSCSTLKTICING